MTRGARAIVVAIAAAGAIGWWALPITPASPPPQTTSVREVAPRAPRPPLVIEVPPLALIHDAPTRADGLDRVDPCGPLPDDGVSHRVPNVGLYVRRRREQLDASLRDDAEDVLGRRLRGALRAATPVRADAGVPPVNARFATLVSLSVGARAAHRYETARAYAEEVIAIAPEDPLGFILLHAVASFGPEPRHDRRATMLHAFRLAPHEPEIASWTLVGLETTPDLMGAIEAADAYLDVVPDSRMAARRAHLAALAHAFSDGVRQTRGEVTVIGSATITPAEVEHTFELLETARARVRATTHAEPVAQIAYVFDDAESMHRATCVAGERPPRREALFVTRGALATESGAATLVEDAARWGFDRSLGLVPSWLRDAFLTRAQLEDEDHPAYAAIVRRQRWIPIADLEGELAHPDTRDGRLARAEARAIVEWLVARRGEDLVDALWDERRVALLDPTAALSRVAGAPLDEPTLLAFMAARARRDAESGLE